MVAMGSPELRKKWLICSHSQDPLRKVTVKVTVALLRSLRALSVDRAILSHRGVFRFIGDVSVTITLYMTFHCLAGLAILHRE
jgi:hypothetical protein